MLHLRVALGVVSFIACASAAFGQGAYCRVNSFLSVCSKVRP